MTPATPATIHKTHTVQTKLRMRLAASIVSCAFAFGGSCALAFAGSCALAFAADPPADLTRRVAARETITEAARSRYMYRQSVRVEDFHPNGIKAGEYGEVREIIFLADGTRSEREVKKPWNRLVRIKLTDEDFRDLREVQPMLLTKDTLFIYETKYKGEEEIDGIDCWLLSVRPRQILEGMRLFDGMLWIDKRDHSIIRSEGQAVPQIRTSKNDNLFPHFTTLRKKIDGEHWFPVKTYGDDILHFRTGSERMRIIVEYADYKRFGSESTIRFEPPK